MGIQELLRELGSQFGIDDLQADEEGLCSLSLDNRLTITFEMDADAGVCYLYETLGNVPVEQLGEVYGQLLKANFFGHETGQAFFTISPDTDEVYLMQRLEGIEALSFDDFYAAVEGFTRYLDHWQGRFASGELFTDADVDEEKPVAAPNRPTQGLRV